MPHDQARIVVNLDGKKLAEYDMPGGTYVAGYNQGFAAAEKKYEPTRTAAIADLRGRHVRHGRAPYWYCGFDHQDYPCADELLARRLESNEC